MELFPIIFVVWFCQFGQLYAFPNIKDPVKRSLARNVNDLRDVWDEMKDSEEDIPLLPEVLMTEIIQEKANVSSTSSPELLALKVNKMDISELVEEPEVRESRQKFLQYDDLQGELPSQNYSQSYFEISFDLIGEEPIDPEVYKISTTIPPTPMVDFTEKARLGYGQACSVYGEHINEVQMSHEVLIEKKKKFGEELQTFFGSEICNFKTYHLECVPDEPRNIFTPPPFKPYTGTPSIDYSTEEKLVWLEQPQGKCLCIRAMGEKAFWNEGSGGKNRRCVIPADQGYHSNCGFDIFYPGGEIMDTPTSTKRSIPAAEMCVRNSECTSGYHYTGLRCHCKKGSHLTPKGKCIDNAGQKVQPGYSVIITSVCIVMYFNLQFKIYNYIL